jgi:hypothetical protein
MKLSHIREYGPAFLPLLLGIGLVYAGVIFALSQDQEPAPIYSLLPPPKTFPAVSNLGEGAAIEGGFPSLSYGVHTFLWWNESYRTWDLDNMRQMNFYYARQSFSWDTIQPLPGVWKWHLADEVVAEAAYRGRYLVARIDAPPDWVVRPQSDPRQAPYDLAALEEFCYTLSARYSGQIVGYQVWNEPNLAREWSEQVPNPAAYVQVLAACARGLRAGDPAAIVISAGLSPTGNRDLQALPDVEFLWRMYEAGAAEHFDVLGLHAPGFALPPEASEAEALAGNYPPWARFRHVETMRAIMVANGDAHKQIAILEMGWTTDTRPDSIYSWFGVDQATQADYLVRAFAYAAEHWRPWVGLMTVIYLSKDIWTPDTEEWWWSIDEPAAPPFWKTPRPAYFALSNMPKVSDNPEFIQAQRLEGEPVYLEPLPPRR